MERPEIIKELERVMLEKNISLESASRLIECSKSTVSRWLAGKSRPSKIYAEVLKRAIQRMRKLKGGNQD